MPEETWPVTTPRDEVLARVAARGNRLRAVRGAINALAVVTVMGASALGVGAAVQSLSDGSPATEMDSVALGPEPPSHPVRPLPDGSTDGSADDPTGTTTGGSTSSTSTDTTGSTDPSGPATTGGSGSTGGSATTRPTPSTRPGSGDTTTSSGPAATSVPTTTLPAPSVQNVRMKAEGVVIGLTPCSDPPDSVVAVEISGADTATMNWTEDGQTVSIEMSPDSTEWVAPLGELDDNPSDVPIIVTIEATGPGGTTYESVVVEVGDCSPPTTDPSDPATVGPDEADARDRRATRQIPLL